MAIKLIDSLSFATIYQVRINDGNWYTIDVQIDELPAINYHDKLYIQLKLNYADKPVIAADEPYMKVKKFDDYGSEIYENIAFKKTTDDYGGAFWTYTYTFNSLTTESEIELIDWVKNTDSYLTTKYGVIRLYSVDKEDLTAIAEDRFKTGSDGITLEGVDIARFITSLISIPLIVPTIEDLRDIVLGDQNMGVQALEVDNNINVFEVFNRCMSMSLLYCHHFCSKCIL